MSGIFGRRGWTNEPNPEASLQATPLFGQLERKCLIDVDARIFLAATMPPAGDLQDRVANHNGSFAVLDGVALLRDRAGSESKPVNAGQLLQLFERHGEALLERLKGRFNAALWLHESNEFVLFNDAVGHRLLYCARRQNQLILGSNIDFVIRQLAASPTISLTALSELINYGFVLGDGTLFQEIRVLAPGTIVRINARGVTQRCYWHVRHVPPEQQFDETMAQRMGESMKQALRETIAVSPGAVAVSLTGGLDSRLIYAAAHQVEPDIAAHTAGQRNSTDVELARQIAELYGTRHIFEQISLDATEQWLAPMVFLQGGLMATMHSHPCQLLQQQLPTKNLMQGVGGEFSRGADWVTLADLDSRGGFEFFNSRLQLQNARTIGERPLWQPHWLTQQRQAREAHLLDVVSQHATDDAPAAVLKTLSLYDLSRKFLNKSGVIASVTHEIHYPYMDQDWVKLVAALPLAERLRHSIQIETLRYLDVRLLKRKYAKTGLAMDASPSLVRLRTNYLRVSGRIARCFGKTAGNGVPNHRYHEWLRSQSDKLLRRTLLRSDAAYREFFRQSAVKRVIGEHQRGVRNWEPLISALMVFELAHLLWIEQADGWLDPLHLQNAPEAEPAQAGRRR